MRWRDRRLRRLGGERQRAGDVSCGRAADCADYCVGAGAAVHHREVRLSGSRPAPLIIPRILITLPPLIGPSAPAARPGSVRRSRTGLGVGRRPRIKSVSCARRARARTRRISSRFRHLLSYTGDRPRLTSRTVGKLGCHWLAVKRRRLPLPTCSSSSWSVVGSAPGGQRISGASRLPPRVGTGTPGVCALQYRDLHLHPCAPFGNARLFTPSLVPSPLRPLRRVALRVSVPIKLSPVLVHGR